MSDGVQRRGMVIADLDRVDGSGGVVWSLPHEGDLDANLVRLGPGQRVLEHVNDEVDVLVVVRSGSGEITIDDYEHELVESSIALVPVGWRRSITASPDGLTYLTIHRRRGPLTVSPVPSGSGGRPATS
jgi:quercetin dioxygenase-like cupin family protein